MRLPRTLTGWTIAIFGLAALVLGVIGLISPAAQFALLGFDLVDDGLRGDGDYTRVFHAASGVAAVNMGAYYVLAALIDFRPFFVWTVPFRILTFTVFTTLVVNGTAPPEFFGVALWEGLGAVVTGLALLYERRSDRPKPKRSAISGD